MTKRTFYLWDPPVPAPVAGGDEVGQAAALEVGGQGTPGEKPFPVPDHLLQSQSAQSNYKMYVRGGKIYIFFTIGDGTFLGAELLYESACLVVYCMSVCRYVCHTFFEILIFYNLYILQIYL